MTQSKMTQSGTLTPCQKLGYKTGDKFTHTTIREGEEFFTQGQVITLTDDGSSMPEFNGIDDNGREDYWYLSLEDVTPFVESPVKLTPAQEMGYKVEEPTQPSESKHDLSKLRDKIAMQQLAVLTPLYWEVQDKYETGKALVDSQVEAAYEYADAMLKQRLKGGSSL